MELENLTYDSGRDGDGWHGDGAEVHVVVFHDDATDGAVLGASYLGGSFMDYDPLGMCEE